MLCSELEVVPFWVFSCSKLRFQKSFFDSKLLCFYLEVVLFRAFSCWLRFWNYFFFRLLGTQKNFSVHSCFAKNWKKQRFWFFLVPNLDFGPTFFQIAWNTKKFFGSKLPCSELEVVPFRVFSCSKLRFWNYFFFRLLGTQESFSIQSCCRRTGFETIFSPPKHLFLSVPSCFHGLLSLISGKKDVAGDLSRKGGKIKQRCRSQRSDFGKARKTYKSKRKLRVDAPRRGLTEGEVGIREASSREFSDILEEMSPPKKRK